MLPAKRWRREAARRLGSTAISRVTIKQVLRRVFWFSIFTSHPTKRSEAIPLSIVGEGRLTVLLKDASSFGVADVEFVGITSASQNKVRQ